MIALTLAEACDHLHLTPIALWKLVESGDLVAIRVSREHTGLRISDDSIASLLGESAEETFAAVIAARKERSPRQRERARWHEIVRRCENPRAPNYCYYGARGITVCDRWHDFDAYYSDILRLIGPCPPGRSLDRINNEGDYEPLNVRWATASEQITNQRKRQRKAAAS